MKEHSRQHLIQAGIQAGLVAVAGILSAGQIYALVLAYCDHTLQGYCRLAAIVVLSLCYPRLIEKIVRQKTKCRVGIDMAVGEDQSSWIKATLQDGIFTVTEHGLRKESYWADEKNVAKLIDPDWVQATNKKSKTPTKNIDSKIK